MEILIQMVQNIGLMDTELIRRFYVLHLIIKIREGHLPQPVLVGN